MSHKSLTERLFDDSDTAALDPFNLFEAWLAEAIEAEVNDPNAMALATVDMHGVPDLRMVLLNGRGADGFVFYTNLGSAKASELAVNSSAALLFHWKSLRLQVRIRGHAVPVSAADADAYFASRPRMSQLGAHASAQSRVLPFRAELVDRVAELKAEFEGKSVPRPPHWSGYRVEPDEFEFWKDGEARLHDRMHFRRDGAGGWTRQRLYP
jgi:pyridoxamine 5'-phosphate oxidase